MYAKTVLFFPFKPPVHSFKYLHVHSALNMSIDIGDLRAPYKSKNETFLEKDIVIKEPINQFKLWFDEVLKNTHIIEKNAMCLATATKNGIPSARFVLLKSFGKDGFKFFTNYDSKKGADLSENPEAALTFYWDVLNRCVRIEGRVEKLDILEAEAYFQKRPRQSQIGACVSQQSSVIAGRHVLMEKEKELSNLYKDSAIPRPKSWGGYVIVPRMIEFWQGQSNRLHDRIRFRRPEPDEIVDGVLVHKGDNGWVYERLAP